MWIVGSSLIKNAFVTARSRPRGANLGLQDSLQTRLWWHGKSGLVTEKIRKEIDIMSRYEGPPDIIIIHIGGNDIGHVRLGYLQLFIKRLFEWLWDQFPGSLMVWSQILPRITWRYSVNLEAMERVRRRINSTVAKYVIVRGGGYIHYPDIKSDFDCLQLDGVHLNPYANEYFILMIQGALEAFLTNTGMKSYPY